MGKGNMDLAYNGSYDRKDLIDRYKRTLAYYKENNEVISRRLSAVDKFFKWLKARKLKLTSKILRLYIDNCIPNFSENKSSKLFARNSILIFQECCFGNCRISAELQAGLLVALDRNGDFYKHLQWLKRAKQLKPNTLQQRYRLLQRFEQYLKVYGIKYEEIDLNTIRHFYKLIQAGHAYKYNVNHMLSVLFKWLYNENLSSIDLTPFIPKVKYRPQSIPDPLNESQLSTLWKSTALDTSSKGKRTRAILGILLSTALRRFDVVQIKLSDLEWSANSVILHVTTSKNNAQLSFNLPSSVGNAIFRYIREARPNRNSPFLFQNNKGNPLNPEVVFNDIFGLYKKLNMLSKHGRNGPHRIRASIATMSVNKGNPDYVVTAILSHQSSSSLKSYVSFNLKSLKRCSLEMIPIQGGYFYNLISKGDRNE